MRSLIIHLPRSIERQTNVSRLVQQLPKSEVIDAVDGRDPAQIQGVPQHGGDLFKPTYPFALQPGEVGCFLSHRACWQKIINSGWDAAIIAEDDLLIEGASCDDLLTLICRNASPDSFIRIPQKPREIQTNVQDRQGKMSLFTPRYVGLTTTFQLVGRNAAQRLLEHSKQIDRPVDTFLQMHWITGQTMQVYSAQ